MKSSFRYAKVGTAVVGVVVLLTWPFLNSESWRGVLIAALVALPVLEPVYFRPERNGTG